MLKAYDVEFSEETYLKLQVTCFKFCLKHLWGCIIIR
jgi:hypothetical protein